MNLSHLSLLQREVLMLHMMRHRQRYPSDHAEWLVECRQFADAVKRARKPDGTMTVVESGRDCDGSVYDGKIHRNVPATMTGLRELFESVNEWADGPFKLAPWPADEELPCYTSRDLTLEAFEDGHPHVIYT